MDINEIEDILLELISYIKNNTPDKYEDQVCADKVNSYILISKIKEIINTLRQNYE